MESRKYFIKNVHSAYNDDGEEEFKVTIHQLAQEKDNTNFHCLIEIESKNCSFKFITENYDDYQSWVTKISDKDFKNCLDLGDSYYTNVIKDSKDRE